MAVLSAAASLTDVTPFAIGLITAMTQSNRLGVACVLIFLVLGFCLLWRVREERTDIQEGIEGGHP